jgi:hypothetical protein
VKLQESIDSNRSEAERKVEWLADLVLRVFAETRNLKLLLVVVGWDSTALAWARGLRPPERP